MIRRCSPTAPPVLVLLDALSEHYRHVYGASDVTPTDLDIALVAFDSGGQPVAVIGWQMLDDCTAYLRRLYVVPAARGRHWGSRLVEAAFVQAAEDGYQSLLFDTDDQHEWVRRQGERRASTVVPPLRPQEGASCYRADATGRLQPDPAA